MNTLTPLEAVMVLHQAEKRLGHPIPDEDIKHLRLGKWPKPEDFDVLPVSSLLFLPLSS